MDTKRKTPPARFLDRKAAAKYIGLSDFWLERHCNDHNAPRWFRHGRKCWYRRTDLDAWLRAKKEEQGDTPSVWRTAEARQIPVPSERELESSYVDEWGEDEATTKKTAEEKIRAAFDKLNGEQMKALAKAIAGFADEAVHA